MKHAVVPRLWPGETIVCMASGPSLTAEDAEYCRGKARVIVVNTTYQLAPWADVLWGCDAKWWRWHNGAKDFTGMKYSLERPTESYGVTVLKSTGISGLETSPHAVRTGRNGGYQAMNLAYHLGASRIVLLGYDCQRAADGREHWHKDHPNRSRSPYDVFLKQFPTILAPLVERGVSVVNSTRSTALDCFPCLPLAEALQ